MTRKNRILVYLFISLLLVLLFIADLLLGSLSIPLSDLLDLIFKGSSSNELYRSILFDFRFPKAITAVLSGIALSVSGLQMQTVFRNPLAGPYVLGVSAGASLGVAIFVLGFSTTMTVGALSALSVWPLAVVAWMGSFLVMLLIMFISARINNIMTILILGMLFSGAVTAIVSILQYFSDETMLKSFIVWSMGSLGSVTISQLKVFAPAVIVGLIIAVFKVKDLDAFLLGEKYAHSLGVNVRNGRMIIFLSTSLLAGSVTAFCGPIGFVGIAVPHLCRILFRTSSHLVLFPATVIMGAVVMLLSDIVSQLPGTNITLPINSVTALVGIPFIIWILLKNRKLASSI